jgi:isopenicillin N synthase-like dioxygenase
MLAHDFSAIPQLDLSLADDPARKSELLEQLRHALTNVGFLYVRNHGVPDGVVGDMINVALRAIPILSAEAKTEMALERSPHFLGYSSVGSETTAGRTDHREQMEFATELPERWKPGRPLYERLVGPNQVRSRRGAMRCGCDWALG